METLTHATSPPAVSESVPNPPRTPTRGVWPLLLIVLVIGIVARVALFKTPGYQFDIKCFRDWSIQLASLPLAEFHQKVPACNYPPLYLLVLKGVGHAGLWLDNSWPTWMPFQLSGDELFNALVRIPPCLADLAIALLLFVEARRVAGAGLGVGAAALYFLNPVSIYNSAYWGQVDAVHSAFLLWALVATNRRHSLGVGVAVGLALMQKLQSVAFLPLFLFDVYRFKRWRGMGLLSIGTAFAVSLICAPYALTGSLDTALRRGYVDVVGQYKLLSVEAFNVWFLTGHPNIPDESVPAFVGILFADGADSIALDRHPFLRLTWKRLSLCAYVTLVAVVLALYSRTSGWASRSLCAGLLGLTFFLVLTEMHERYLHPALALLPLWAVTTPWRERVYVAVSVLLLINMAAVLPPDPLGGWVAGLLVLAGFGMMSTWFARRSTHEAGDTPMVVETGAYVSEAAPSPSGWVRGFVAITAVWLVLVAGGAAYLGFRLFQLERWKPESDEQVLYLSDLEPAMSKQSYGRPQNDRSVEGGLIQHGDRLYFRGIGTHAPFTLEYDIPPGFDRFEALVDLNHHFTGRADALVHLDGKSVFVSPVLSTDTEPVEVSVALDGARRLRLSGKAGEETKGDHIDWALARFVKDGAEGEKPE